MSLHFFKTVKRTIKHWYLPLLAGIVLIAIGIWTFKEPVDSYVALALLFSLSFVVSGLFEAIFSIANRDVIDSWGWHLAMGIITLIVGVLMFMNPDITMLTLPFYVGFVILFRSMNAIGVALDLKSYGILDWGNIMAIGIVGIFLAFVLLWNPLFAGLSIVIWTGIASYGRLSKSFAKYFDRSCRRSQVFPLYRSAGLALFQLLTHSGYSS